MRRRSSTAPILVASVTTITSMFASPAAAHADSVPAARDLAPTEVRAHLRAVDPAIASCYLGAVGNHTRAGKLEVVLSIHRKGLVDRIDVRAPGLPAKTVTKIDGCIRSALTGVTFPARRTGTTAVVPYFWQKTAALGAGPLESCWNPAGCKHGDDGRDARGGRGDREVVEAQGTKAEPTRQARRAPRA